MTADASADPASVWLDRAQRALDDDRPGEVGEYVRAGLAVVGDDLLRLRLRLTGAVWAAENSGHRAAQSEIEAIGREADRLGNGELVALCHAQQAYMLLRSGELRSAADRLAVVDAEALSPVDRTRLLLNRGTLSAHLEPGSGAEDLDQAVRLARAGGQTELEFRGLHNLGWLAFLRGDLVEALEQMRTADQIEATVDRTVARLDQARVLLEAGLVREAHTTLESASAAAGAAGQHHTVAEIELELARAERLLGDPAQARERIGTAERSFLEHGATAWVRRAQLSAAALSVSGGRTSTSLERQLRGWYAAASAQGDVHSLTTSLLTLAESALLRQRPELAKKRLDELPGAIGRRSAQISVRLRVLGLTARVAAADGDGATASRLLRAASHELAQARHQQAGLDLRTAIAIHARPLAELDVALGVATGRPSSVLIRSERWRASIDHVPSVRRASQEPEATQLLLRLRAAREDLRTAPPGQPSAALAAQARRWERELRATAWQLGAATDPVLPVSLSRLRATLAEHGRALVAYVAHRGRLLVVVVRPGAALKLLDVGEIAGAAAYAARVRAGVLTLARTQIPTSLAATVRNSLVDDLASLGTRVLQPVLRLLEPDQPLVLVPTMHLPNIPWGMVPGTRGRPLTLGRSASAWARAQSPDEVPAPPADLRVGCLAGPGLALAQSEVEDVARIWSPREARTTRVDIGDSTPERLSGLLADCDLVHVAAHGSHDHESPLFSSIRTSAGPAFAHELERDRVAARHVVLAACDAGRATMRPGDEPLGLAATLLSLGVSSVIAPTTVVPDEDAHALVVAHHRGLAAGLDSDVALAQAIAQSPLLAGGFTAFGASWRAAR